MVVALVALAASLAGVLNDFAYDDILVVLHDDRVQSASRWAEFLTSPYWAAPHVQDLYRPIASLLLAAEYALGGGGPLIFRVVSYALYAASAVAVFALASRLLSRRAALAVAVLFAAHPVHVEAVAQAVNQAELVVGLIAVVMVCRYVDRRRARDLRSRDWIILAALYAVAMLTKENGFVLPGLLVVAELVLIADVPLRARIRTLWRGYLSLAAIAAVILMIRATVLSGDVVGAFTAEALVGLGLGGRMLTMLQVVPMWVRLFVWPAHLQIDYSPNEIVASSGFGPHEALGLGLVLAAIAVVYVVRRRAPVVSFGLLWCAIALFPVSNIVPTSIVLAERTLFLPSIGFLLAAGALGASLVTFAKRPASVIRVTLVHMCVVLTILGIARSAERQRDWRNAAHVWVVASHDAPRSLRVQRARESAIADLAKEFEPVIAAADEPWRLRFQLAVLFRTMEEDSAAVVQLRRSLEEHAAQPDAQIELGEILLEEGHYTEAKAVARSGIVGGDTAQAFRQIEQAADSAEAVSAPPGTVSLHTRT